MSRENVELVRGAFEGLNARSVGRIADVVAPDMEWRPILTAGNELERRVYRGPAGIEQYWADLDELFESTHIEVEALSPVDSDRVLFSGRVTARGRTSGVPLDQPIWALFEVREGRLTRGTAFRGRAEALEAAGRPE